MKGKGTVLARSETKKRKEKKRLGEGQRDTVGLGWERFKRGVKLQPISPQYNSYHPAKDLRTTNVF